MRFTLNITRNMVKLALIIFVTMQMSCGDGSSTTTTVTASAGDDRDVLVNTATALDGNSSVGVRTVSWTLESQPSGSSATLSGSTTLTPSFTPDVTGAYVIELSINGNSSTDSVTITAKSIVAAITLGSGSTVTTRTRFGTTEYIVDLEQASGILSAETSLGSVASYSWEQVSGPGATASGGSTGSTLTFTAPSLAGFFNASDHYKWQLLPVSRDDTKMIFKLTVSDSSGNSDSATLSVFVQDDGSEIHTSSGLPNVGLGTVVYLSGPDLDSTGASTTVAANENGDPITDWSWALSIPSGSSATLIDSGTTTSTLQFPKFVPDVAGLYTVTYSSTTGNATSTNPTTKGSGTLSINAAEYVGVGTVGGTTALNPQCGTCHDGTVVEDDMLTEWSETNHASIFENSISLYDSLAPEPYLWQFHTVGYNTDADSDGFDDLASDESFTFPDAGMTFVEFTTDHADVAVLANVQCESCHGPGSLHSGDPTRIEFSASQFGVCGQCHIQESQWKNSAHNMTGVAHGSGGYQGYWVTNAGCIRCHNSNGFISYLESGEDELATVAADFETGDFTGITCAGCHNPHDATNEHQLRVAGNVTMVVDGSTVDAGHAAACYTCHDGFYEYGEDDCDDNDDGTAESICTTVDQVAVGYFRQVHYNPQAPVLEGKGALNDLNGDGTDDFALDENSFHSDADFTLASVTGDSTLSDENNKCVTCHMATGPTAEEEGYEHLGGHAFKLRSGHSIGHLSGEETEDDAEAEEEDLTLVSICQSCHPTVTEFNRTARADYDGDGLLEGIQDEVEGLLVALTTKIKAQDTVNVKSTSGTVESGGTITVNALSYTGSTAAAQGTSFRATSDTLKRGIWNHNLIARDGSLGVHNAAFTVQVLQGTYTAAGGNSFATDYPDAEVR